MKKILLDTNILMAVYQFKVDIFSEFDRICDFGYKLFILDNALEELENIRDKQKGKNKDAAKLGLKLLKLKNVEILKAMGEENTDKEIVKMAKKGYIVATQDAGLKRALKSNKVQIITLRQKKYLILQ